MSHQTVEITPIANIDFLTKLMKRITRLRALVVNSVNKNILTHLISVVEAIIHEPSDE